MLTVYLVYCGYEGACRHLIAGIVSGESALIMYVICLVH
jgi:hypothetical protein